MAINPYAQGTGGGPSDLEERKRRLMEWLASHGASQPYQALPLFGAGRSSHGGSDFPQAALPALTFNPFLSQIAGRGENFPQLPAGVGRGQAQAAQAGPPGVLGGRPIARVVAPPPPHPAQAPSVVQPGGGQGVSAPPAPHAQAPSAPPAAIPSPQGGGNNLANSFSQSMAQAAAPRNLFGTDPLAALASSIGANQFNPDLFAPTIPRFRSAYAV